MSREQFIAELRNNKYADLAKNSLRLVILECYEEIKDLERQLEEAREAFKKIKDLSFNDFDHDAIRIHGIACKQLKEKSDE